MPLARQINLLVLAIALLASLAFGFRLWLVRSWTADARKIALEKIGELPKDAYLDVAVLNFSRGDFEVIFKKPPFKAKAWTVNRLTGEIIPQGYQ